MDGNGGDDALPGAYAPPGATTAGGMDSSSTLNNSSSVSVVPRAGVQAAYAMKAGDPVGSAGEGGGYPVAKRARVEGPESGSAAATVASMASIAANRAMTTPTPPAASTVTGSGMTTHQFLQSLPTAYAMANPSIAMMMQQQQQQQHQHQQQQQQQLQQVMQFSRQFNAPMPSYMTPHQSQQQQQQVHAMMMAAMANNAAAAQNRAAFAVAQGQEQQMLAGRVGGVTGMPSGATGASGPVSVKQEFVPTIPAAIKREQGQANPGVTKAETVSKPPPLPQDHACYVCQEKGDVVTCSASCGLHVHVRCVGADMFFPSPTGKICGSCHLMVQDRNSKENLQKGGATGISVRRAILCLNVETNGAGSFEKFGHLASLRLYEIAQIAGYPIGPFATKFVEPYLQRWVREKLVHASKWPMNVRDVFTVMIGLYSLDCAGISHGWKETVIEMVNAKKYSATDFLGWHPAIEGPNVKCSSLCAVCCIRNPPELPHCGRCRRQLVFPTIFTKFVSAMLASFYAERVGISFGVSFIDVFAHLNSVRGHYKGLKPVDAEGADWESFADQMRMIFGLLDIVSNFGLLQLKPELFEPEVKIIFNQMYLSQAMQAMEYEVVGKFLQCMKIFGPDQVTEHRSVIDVCERFLLTRQLANGSWCKMGGSVIDQYKATVVCAKALVSPVIRGHGPVSSDVRRLLEKWAKKMPAFSKRLQDAGTGKILACGATAKPKTVLSLKKLEQFYRRQVVPSGGVNALETLATARLRAIWSTQKLEPQDEDMKDGATAATDTEDNEISVVKTEKTEVDATADESAQGEEDDLTKLSLSGDLTLFDGLKFEDGDVIDISNQALGELEGEKQAEMAREEADAGDDEGSVAGEEGDETEDDVYDDDDEGDDNGNYGDVGAQDLPEPEEQIVAEQDDPISAAESSGLPVDDEYSQSSLDLTLDI